MAARITRAFAEGRIGAADRDIRLGNVRSAQSLAELDLMTRDLDQLEAALPTATEPAAPYSAFDPKAAKHSTDVTAGGGPRRLVAIIGVVVAVVLLVGAVAAVAGNRIGGFLDEGPSTSPGAPAEPGDPGPQDVDDPQPDPPAGPAYSLTAKGITDWLAAYRQKFGTSLL